MENIEYKKEASLNNHPSSLSYEGIKMIQKQNGIFTKIILKKAAIKFLEIL